MLLKLINKKLLYSPGVSCFINEDLDYIKDYLNQLVLSNENYKKSISKDVTIEYTIDAGSSKIVFEIEDKTMNREYTSVSVDRKGNRLVFFSGVKKDNPEDFSVEDVYQYYDRDVQIDSSMVCKKGFSSHFKVFKEKGNLTAIHFDLYDKRGNKIVSKSTAYNTEEMNSEYKKHA